MYACNLQSCTISFDPPICSNSKTYQQDQMNQQWWHHISLVSHSEGIQQLILQRLNKLYRKEHKKQIRNMMSRLLTYHHQREGGHGVLKSNSQLGKKLFWYLACKNAEKQSHYVTVKLSNIPQQEVISQWTYYTICNKWTNEQFSVYLHQWPSYLSHKCQYALLSHGGKFPQNSPITSANHQNLHNAILPLKIVWKLE